MKTIYSVVSNFGKRPSVISFNTEDEAKNYFVKVLMTEQDVNKQDAESYYENHFGWSDSQGSTIDVIEHNLVD